MVLNTLNPELNQELYHHPDRCSQYCSDAYAQILTTHLEIKISMTENGDRYENAIAERINGILKSEFNLDQIFPSMVEMKASVEKSIDGYNEKNHCIAVNQIKSRDSGFVFLAISHTMIVLSSPVEIR